MTARSAEITSRAYRASPVNSGQELRSDFPSVPMIKWARPPSLLLRKFIASRAASASLTAIASAAPPRAAAIALSHPASTVTSVAKDPSTPDNCSVAARITPLPSFLASPIRSASRRASQAARSRSDPRSLSRSASTFACARSRSAAAFSYSESRFISPWSNPATCASKVEKSL